MDKTGLPLTTSDVDSQNPVFTLTDTLMQSVAPASPSDVQRLAVDVVSPPFVPDFINRIGIDPLIESLEDPTYPYKERAFWKLYDMVVNDPDKFSRDIGLAAIASVLPFGLKRGAEGVSDAVRAIRKRAGVGDTISDIIRNYLETYKLTGMGPEEGYRAVKSLRPDAVPTNLRYTVINAIEALPDESTPADYINRLQKGGASRGEPRLGELERTALLDFLQELQNRGVKQVSREDLKAVTNYTLPRHYRLETPQDTYGQDVGVEPFVPPALLTNEGKETSVQTVMTGGYPPFSRASEDFRGHISFRLPSRRLQDMRGKVPFRDTGYYRYQEARLPDGSTGMVLDNVQHDPIEHAGTLSEYDDIYQAADKVSSMTEELSRESFTLLNPEKQIDTPAGMVKVRRIYNGNFIASVEGTPYVSISQHPRNAAIGVLDELKTGISDDCTVSYDVPHTNTANIVRAGKVLRSLPEAVIPTSEGPIIARRPNLSSPKVTLSMPGRKDVIPVTATSYSLDTTRAVGDAYNKLINVNFRKGTTKQGQLYLREQKLLAKIDNQPANSERTYRFGDIGDVTIRKTEEPAELHVTSTPLCSYSDPVLSAYLPLPETAQLTYLTKLAGYSDDTYKDFVKGSQSLKKTMENLSHGDSASIENFANTGFNVNVVRGPDISKRPTYTISVTHPDPGYAPITITPHAVTHPSTGRYVLAVEGTDNAHSFAVQHMLKEYVQHNIMNAGTSRPVSLDRPEYNKRWVEQLTRSALQDAIEKDYDFIVIPTGRLQVERWGNPGLEKIAGDIYDSRIPKELDRLGKRYGTQTEKNSRFFHSLGLPGSQTVHIFRIPKTMKEDIKKSPLTLYSTIGAMAGAGLASQQQGGYNDQEE